MVFKDNDGRYLAVEMLNRKKTLIVGLYAPNGAIEMYF